MEGCTNRAWPIQPINSSTWYFGHSDLDPSNVPSEPVKKHTLSLPLQFGLQYKHYISYHALAEFIAKLHC